MRDFLGRIVLVVCLVTVAAGVAQCDLQPVQVLLDGRAMSLDASAYFIDRKFIMAPAVSYLQGLGATVSWDPRWQSIHATRGGVSLSMAIGRDTATVDGHVRQLGGSPLMVNGLPYVFVRFPAESFGFAVAWSRESLTVRITTPTRQTLTATLVMDQDLPNPRLVDLGGGQLLVVGGSEGVGGGRVVHAFGSHRGERWQVNEHPAPGRLQVASAIGGWGMGADFLLCYSGLAIPPSAAGDMPLWSLAGNEWLDSHVTESPAVGRRQILEMAVTDAQARTLYATGWETRTAEGDGLRARLWRSTDSSVTWEPIEVRGLAPYIMARIEAVGPDRTVWVWVDKNLLRIEPDGGITELNLPANLWTVSCMSAPTASDVFMLWKQAVPGSTTPRWVFSQSADRGVTWQHESDFPWPTELMDWADGRFGMFAHKFAGTWALYYTKDRGQHWFRSKLEGWEVVGDRILVVSSTEAYMLARRAGSADRRLHCLRWELGQ